MLSKKLKRLRLIHNINQSQLANEIGVTQSAIGRWETGMRSPDFETIDKLAKYFKVTTDYLIRDEQTPETLLLARLSGLSEEDKSKLISEFDDTIDIYLKAKGV